MKACFQIVECSLFYLKAVPTSTMKACFQIVECSLFYLKAVPTSTMKACFQIVECSLFYLKAVPTSTMKACFQIVECSLFYLKIKNIGKKQMCFFDEIRVWEREKMSGYSYRRVMCTSCIRSRTYMSYGQPRHMSQSISERVGWMCIISARRRVVTPVFISAVIS